MTGEADVLVDQFLGKLLTLASSPSPLPCVCLRALQTHRIKKYEAESATFSFPLRGAFRYREKESWITVQPGEMLVVPNARSLDIEYVAARASGEFIALSVILFDEQLEAARLLLATPPVQDIGVVAAVSVTEVLDPLVRWNQAMSEGKRALALHALVEVLLKLYALGHHGLLRPRDPSLAMKIRQMVSEAPAFRWTATEIEQRFGLSGPTLRRRLAAESTSLRAIIADARIAQALRLLMGSELPLKTIAGRVGYSSIASFSKQFSNRYGVEPSGFR